MPLAHDQPDKAARVKRLGAGGWLKPAAFREATVAKALERLLTSAEVRRSCERAAASFAGAEPFAESCGVIEQFAARLGL